MVQRFYSLSFSKKRLASRMLLGLTLVLAIGACNQNGFSALDSLPDDPTKEVYDPGMSKPLTDPSIALFKEPNYTTNEAAAVLAQYPQIDPNHEVDTKLLAQAILYYNFNKAHLGNTAVMTVIDYSLKSTVSRFYMIDMTTGSVTSTHVAHGIGSDSNNDGYAEAFSNTPNSEMTSLGAYVTAESYSGNYGYSLRLDGVSSTNSNARARGIVLHGAYYVVASDQQPGRSWGCPAIPMTQRTEILDRLKGGSLIFAGASKLIASPVPSPTPKPTATPAPTATPKPSTSPTPAPTAAPTPSPTPISGSPLIAALWETSSYAAGNGQKWSQYAYNIVAASPNLIAGPSDVTNFCPKYRSLTTQQKTSFWVYFVSSVTKYESGQNPVSRMAEALGTDPITGKQVESEGLLQLSYQDKLNYPFCNEFDWSVDKSLSPTDPKKTILDPYKNLACGIRIMNKIFGSHNAIAFKSGNYWSTLMTGGTYSKVPQIQALTKAISFCQ